jgi:hypothetical protein
MKKIGNRPIIEADTNFSKLQKMLSVVVVIESLYIEFLAVNRPEN